MSGTDRYGCKGGDDRCLVETFESRAKDAKASMDASGARIEHSARGVPRGSKPTWRRGKSASHFDR